MSHGNQQNGCEDTRESEAMRKLFIGGTEKNLTTDEKLFECFSQFGKIVDHVVMKDQETQKSRGFGFVTFEESASVEKAFKSRPINLDGKDLDIKRAMPKEYNTADAHEKTTRLFVGGLKGSNITPEELQAYIENRHPTEFGSCTKIDFLKADDGSLKGFGFIDCSDNDFADRLVISENKFSLSGRSLSITKAHKKGGGGGDQGGFRGGRGGNQGGNRGANRGGRGGYAGNRGGYGGSHGGFGGNQSYNQYGNSGGYNNYQGGGYHNQGGSYNQGGYQQQAGGYNSGYGQSSGGYSGNY